MGLTPSGLSQEADIDWVLQEPNSQLPQDEQFAEAERTVQAVGIREERHEQEQTTSSLQDPRVKKEAETLDSLAAPLGQ